MQKDSTFTFSINIGQTVQTMFHYQILEIIYFAVTSVQCQDIFCHNLQGSSLFLASMQHKCVRKALMPSCAHQKHFKLFILKMRESIKNVLKETYCQFT